jgi:hypothetical protein
MSSLDAKGCHSSATVQNSETIISSVAQSTTATTASANANANDSTTNTANCGHSRGPRRRPERRRPVSYEVDFGVPASFRATVARDWILTTSCTALWKHFLYARGLIPVPTNQLDLSEQQQQQQHRLSSGQRKMLLTAEKIQKLQSDLEEVVTHDKLHVSYVLLTLGASSVRPKEVYLLDFAGLVERNAAEKTCDITTTTITRPTGSQRIPVLDENKENVTSTSASTLLARRKKEYTLSTRLIRQVVQAECDAESELTGRDLLAAIQRMSADQLSLTVGVTDSSFDELYREETTRQQQASTSTSASNTGPFILPKVIVRHDFVLPLGKKGVLRSAQIRVFDKDAEVQCEVGAVKEKEEELPLVDDGITWLAFHSKVKGFRLPSSHPL